MALFDLPVRRNVPEQMDAPDLPYEVFRDCLRDLARVNAWTGAYRPTLLWLARLTRRHPEDRPLKVLDIGAGYGDLLRRIAAWGQRRGLPVDLAAVDLNPWSARAAGEAAPEVPIRYHTADLFDLPAGEQPDAIISSLLTHHLLEADVVRCLRWMEARARLGWFVNDLHRNHIPLAFVRSFSALPLHPMVRHDGPVSVARAWVWRDWEQFLAEAGLGGVARIEWFAAFRLCVGRIR